MKKFGRILNVVATALLILLLIPSSFIFVSRTFFHNPLPRIFGYTSAVVLSGSMSDTINVNDVVIIHKQETYAIGDIITFLTPSNTPVTHRIVETTGEGYITKGDANPIPDDPIERSQVVGRVISIIPGVGKISEVVFSPVGTSVCLLVLFCYLFWLYKQEPKTI